MSKQFDFTVTEFPSVQLHRFCIEVIMVEENVQLLMELHFGSEVNIFMPKEMQIKS